MSAPAAPPSPTMSASNPISPHSCNPLPVPSTTSATTPLELLGVASAAAARNPRIYHTCGVLHLYRSSPTFPASCYASAVAATATATPSSSSSGPAAPPIPCISLLPVTIPP
ncbi:hypothetical protein ACQJBY_018466 [Aegilops geniculata]